MQEPWGEIVVRSRAPSKPTYTVASGRYVPVDGTLIHQERTRGTGQLHQQKH